jgi:hypothetical protein
LIFITDTKLAGLIILFNVSNLIKVHFKCIASMLIKKMVSGQGILTEMEVSAWIFREVHGKVKVIYLFIVYKLYYESNFMIEK